MEPSPPFCSTVPEDCPGAMMVGGVIGPAQAADWHRTCEISRNAAMILKDVHPVSTLCSLIEDHETGIGISMPVSCRLPCHATPARGRLPPYGQKVTSYAVATQEKVLLLSSCGQAYASGHFFLKKSEYDVDGQLPASLRFTGPK